MKTFEGNINMTEVGCSDMRKKAAHTACPLVSPWTLMRDSEIPGGRASAGAECLLQDTKLLQCCLLSLWPFPFPLHTAISRQQSLPIRHDPDEGCVAG